MINIKFIDNGCGIDLERHGDELFKPYKRFHIHIEGKGLGLFLVKSHVEALGGEISVVSKPGTGTTFTICLPKDQDLRP
jgi:signal transduction histidine kinase